MSIHAQDPRSDSLTYLSIATICIPPRACSYLPTYILQIRYTGSRQYAFRSRRHPQSTTICQPTPQLACSETLMILLRSCPRICTYFSLAATLIPGRQVSPEAQGPNLKIRTVFSLRRTLCYLAYSPWRAKSRIFHAIYPIWTTALYPSTSNLCLHL